MSSLPRNDQVRNCHYLRVKETQLIRQCCRCGDLKLYTAGPPCMPCRKPMSDEPNSFDIPEHRAWELCTDCGPAACNKILGLTRAYDGIENLYLLRCCKCRTDNVCGARTCAKCGDRGCCRCNIVHGITEADPPNLGRVIASVQNAIVTPYRRQLLPKPWNRDIFASSFRENAKSPGVVEFETGPVEDAIQPGNIAQPTFLPHLYIPSPISQNRPASMERPRTVAEAVAAAGSRRLMEREHLRVFGTPMQELEEPIIKKDMMIGGDEEPYQHRRREMVKEMKAFRAPVTNYLQRQHDNGEILESPAPIQPTFDNESAEEAHLRTFTCFSSDNEKELHISREDLLRYADPIVTISGDFGTAEPAQSSNTGKTTQQTIGENKMMKGAEADSRNGKRKSMADAQSLDSDYLAPFESTNAFSQSRPVKKAKLSGPARAVPAAEVRQGSREEQLTEDSNQPFWTHYQDFDYMSSPSPDLKAQSDDRDGASNEADIEVVGLDDIGNNVATSPEIGELVEPQIDGMFFEH